MGGLGVSFLAVNLLGCDGYFNTGINFCGSWPLWMMLQQVQKVTPPVLLRICVHFRNVEFPLSGRPAAVSIK